MGLRTDAEERWAERLTWQQRLLLVSAQGVFVLGTVALLLFLAIAAVVLAAAEFGHCPWRGRSLRAWGNSFGGSCQRCGRRRSRRACRTCWRGGGCSWHCRRSVVVSRGRRRQNRLRSNKALHRTDTAHGCRSAVGGVAGAVSAGELGR